MSCGRAEQYAKKLHALCFFADAIKKAETFFIFQCQGAIHESTQAAVKRLFMALNWSFVRFLGGSLKPIRHLAQPYLAILS
jgi:hypothetical protein